MIKNNLNIVEEQIKNACSAAGRDRTDITLIAVSKTHPVEDVITAQECGQVHFGENKAREMEEKALKVNEPVIWHFIGHLQTNKVKYIINSAAYIHSVESVKLAKEIEKRASAIDKIQNVMLEIKTSEEDSKFGLDTEKEIYETAEFCKNSGNLALAGLMTMAPLTDDENIIRKSFENLRELKERMNARGFGLQELSMGMTSDFQIAIEEGSTMVRVGTAIFGKREYPV